MDSRAPRANFLSKVFDLAYEVRLILLYAIVMIIIFVMSPVLFWSVHTSVVLYTIYVPMRNIGER